MSWGGGPKMWRFPVLIGQGSPLGVGAKCVLGTWPVTFVLSGLRRSGKPLQRKDQMQKGNVHALQALFHLRRRLLPVRGLLRKSSTPRLLRPSLQESRLRGGGLGVGGEGCLGMHLVLRPVGLPLLPLDLGPARGVEVPLVARPMRTSSLLSPLLLCELRRGELLVRSRRPLPALLPRLPLSAHHCTLCEVVSRESLRRSAPVRDPPVFPDPRIEEQGRIVEPALGWTALVAGLVDLAVKRSRASSAGLVSVAVLPRAVAVFWPLSALSLSLVVSPGSLSAWSVAVFCPLPLKTGAFAIPCSSGRLPWPGASPLSWPLTVTGAVACLLWPFAV